MLLQKLKLREQIPLMNVTNYLCLSLFVFYKRLIKNPKAPITNPIMPSTSDKRICATPWPTWPFVIVTIPTTIPTIIKNSGKNNNDKKAIIYPETIRLSFEFLIVEFFW